MTKPIYSVSLARDGKLTYQEAIAAGYRTINLAQRVWEHEDRIRQDETGCYRGFEDVHRQRNRIEYAVRCPGAHVVKPEYWNIFIVRVSSFKDAERIARKIGEGTVIQRIHTKFRAWHWKERKGKRTAVAFGVTGRGSLYRRRYPRRCAKDEKYRYWMVIDGKLVRMEPLVRAKIVTA